MLLLLLTTVHINMVLTAASCKEDLLGSYGDLRETKTEEFAYVVGMAGTNASLRFWSSGGVAEYLKSQSKYPTIL